MSEKHKPGERLTVRLMHAGLFLVAPVVIGLLWLPVFVAYRVPGIRVTEEMVQRAREFPDDSVLVELSKFSLLAGEWKKDQKLIDTASQLVAGDLETRSCSTRITMPFSRRDLGQVPLGCQLPLAGFWVPEVLLQAYQASGRQEFLDAAQAYISGAQAYGDSAWLPRGQFWNDHALASRIMVLANFWRIYRHSPQYRPEVARQILEMAGRSEQLLAKSGQFTFATNHGVMQNLALWHAALAFPSLPGGQEYRRLATSRLNDQMKFYISDEGVVLEHSAGYQEFGVVLLGRALRYLALGHEAAPPEWVEKYRKAQAVYATLRRPDGSLPMFGDTDSDDDKVGPLVTDVDANGYAGPVDRRADWKPASSKTFYPVSGYSIWWDGLESWPGPRNLSQTVVCWSNFAGHGHKHADEMSVLFWAGGQNWLSNIGYWPYGATGRKRAVSWAGSNAPHLAGEEEGSSRSTQLIASGEAQRMSAIELARTGPDGYSARRQVIQYRPGFWMVLDSTSGKAGAHTTTTWNAGTNVVWRAGSGDGSFLLQGKNPQDALQAFSLSSPAASEKLLQKSSEPFAGWQIEGGQPVGAFALVTEQPVTSWAAMIWQQSDNLAGWMAETPLMSWRSPANWEIKGHSAVHTYVLSRHGDQLVMHHDRGPDERLNLDAAASVSGPLADLRSEFQRASLQYQVVPADLDRRLRFTFVLVPLFLLQETAFAVSQRLQGSWVLNLRWVIALAWIMGAVWLFGFHL